MISIALKFTPENDNAPKVIASGDGIIGEKIYQIAKTRNIPIHKDKFLAKSLSSVPIDEEIPESLYKAVASVFSYLYKIENRLK